MSGRVRRGRGHRTGQGGVFKRVAARIRVKRLRDCWASIMELWIIMYVCIRNAALHFRDIVLIDEYGFRALHNTC